MNAQENVVESNNAVTAVVQNDSAVIGAENAGKVYLANYKRIEQLVNEREVWEQGVMRTSNEQLYALLEKCYALYGEICVGDANAVKLRDALNDFVNMKGYAFLKSTHTLTKIVKCVFGVDRRRVSVYSLVLREALAQKIAAKDLAAFISKCGGVEEVRRSKSATAITPKQKAVLGKNAVSGNKLAVISSDKLAEGLDMAKAGEDLIAIVTQQADGSFIVRALVHSQSVLNAALACAYSASKGVVQNDTANKAAANDDKARDALIAAAAGAAVA